MNLERYSIDIPYGALAQNLVNSHDVSLANPEHLRTFDDVRRFMAHHDLDVGRMTAQDLHRMRALRDTTRQVFESKDARQATRRINALLERKRYAAALSVQDDSAEIGWRISTESDPVAQLEAAVALNLAALLHTVGFDRYRICQAGPCQDVFVDLSKKGGRLFCGPRCASRVHVARFRSRQRD